MCTFEITACRSVTLEVSWMISFSEIALGSLCCLMNDMFSYAIFNDCNVCVKCNNLTCLILVSKSNSTAFELCRAFWLCFRIDVDTFLCLCICD